MKSSKTSPASSKPASRDILRYPEEFKVEMNITGARETGPRMLSADGLIRLREHLKMSLPTPAMRLRPYRLRSKNQTPHE
jgi:hypothetical protein